MGKKLELIWLNKDKEMNVEPRILIEDKKKSFYLDSPANLIDVGPTFNNVLIHGDNLLALKALEQDFSNKIKCIYIDPPYNTGSAFKTYDDGIEHSTWLSLMAPRLKSLRTLLSDNGVIFVQIDDNEHCYLKVLMDEIFGRDNFVADLIWRKKSGGGQDSEYFVIEHEYILVYKKKRWKILNSCEEPLEVDFPKLINGRKAKIVKLEKWGTSPYKEDRPSLHYSIKDPEGNPYFPIAPDGREGRWRKKPESLDQYHIFWTKKDTKWTPYEVLYFDEAKETLIKTRSIWLDFGNNSEAAKEMIYLFSKKVFDTPKPESLIQEILKISTIEGDIVLDSFLGSGTTCAVAHKMKRKWIGIEMGSQAYEICKPRLDLIINGKDKGGITKKANWTSGGGYKFYELAPSLINFDAFGQPIINKEYNADMLAAAIAKHEGFSYEPNKEMYWKQSHNGDKSFLFVTTSHLGADLLDSIHGEMNSDEFLLISCKSFDSLVEKRYKNIAIKKIPQSLLKNCEFGVDNYNLNIVNPPEYEDEDDE